MIYFLRKFKNNLTLQKDFFFSPKVFFKITESHVMFGGLQ